MTGVKGEVGVARRGVTLGQLQRAAAGRSGKALYVGRRAPDGVERAAAVNAEHQTDARLDRIDVVGHGRVDAQVGQCRVGRVGAGPAVARVTARPKPAVAAGVADHDVDGAWREVGRSDVGDGADRRQTLAAAGHARRPAADVAHVDVGL